VNDMNAGKEIVCTIFWAIVWLSIGASIGLYVDTIVSRREAIKAGVAQWTIDPQTGATRFEWIKVEGKP
jgi:hypothetical protein